MIGFLISLIFIPSFVFAEPTAEVQVTDPESVKLVNPIINPADPSNPAGITDLTLIVGGILKQALGILGSLALLVFIYGGFMWVIAAGNAENVKKGTDAMQWAVIGICIIFSSYAIIDLIFQGIGAGISKTASYEKKPGQVWCRDTVKNLCLAVKKTECAGEIFATLQGCKGKDVAKEGVWCLQEGGGCEPTLKSECKAELSGYTIDICQSISKEQPKTE